MSEQGLARRLTTFDAVVVGLGAMLGAGVFAVWAPAAAAAGSGVLVALALAAVVAYCNATSSARLAALYPESGGTYVYGTRQLGPFWGYLAGWAFVVGKTASCAAMALTVGAYVAPDHARPIAVAAVVLLTALNYRGVRKSAFLTRLVVATTLAVLGFVVAGAWIQGARPVLRPDADTGPYGILQAAALLFFAFAGYARIATLGEEVRDPGRTIPRAIPLALGIVLAVYLAVGATLLSTLGAARVAASTAPLAEAVAGVMPYGDLVVRIGAAVAALGALLALVLGVSRTVFAMARDRRLPRFCDHLDAVHPRFGVPHRAEVTVGAVVVALVLIADLRGAIGFSSFGVLLYYAIANASAFTLGTRRVVPVVGVAGCLVLAFAVPWQSVVTGVAVLLVGIGLHLARRRSEGSGASSG